MRQRPSISMPPRAPIGSSASRASSSRGRMPAEKTSRSTSSSSPFAKRSWRTAFVSGSATISRRRGGGVNRDPEVLDPAPQHRAAGLVELQRHQARGELDDVHRHAELGERVRRLQPQQASADHRARTRPGGSGSSPRFESAPGPRSSGRRNSRPRSRPGIGGTNADDPVASTRRSYASSWTEPPVSSTSSTRRVRSSRRTRPPRCTAKPAASYWPGPGEAQLLRRAAVEKRRQADPIVGQARLLADHGHVTGAACRGPRRSPAARRTVADHAVADDDQVLGPLPCMPIRLTGGLFRVGQAMVKMSVST